MKTKLSIRCVLAGSVLLATILQTVAYLTSYTASDNYFRVGTILPILAIVCTAIAAIAGAVDAILYSKENRIQSKDAFPFISAFSAVGFLLTGIRLLPSASNLFGKVGALILLLAAVYCILDMFRAEILSSVTFGFGFAAPIGCIMLTAHHYFDMTLEMNAPIKISLQVALLFSMLFFVGELRCRLGKPQPILYPTVTAMTVAIGAYASIPAIVAYLAGKVTRFDYFCTAILVLGITLTACMRLIAMYFPKSTEQQQNSIPEND